MSISVLNSFTKAMLTCTLAITFFGCTKAVPVEEQEAERQRMKNYANSLNIAFNEAENNNPEGLIKIYRIASKSDSAETAETARDILLHFLYKNPDLWIKTFAKEDLDEFKEYLAHGGLAILNLPKGVVSEEQFDKEIVVRLKRIKGTKKEVTLIEYLLQVYGGARRP